MIRLHLTVTAQSPNQSFNVRPELDRSVVIIGVIQVLRQFIPSIKKEIQLTINNEKMFFCSFKKCYVSLPKSKRDFSNFIVVVSDAG